MKVTDDLVSVKVPAGEYYLGDPCYFFTHEDWDRVLPTCDTFQKPIGKAPNGDPVLGFGTAYGDGSYRGTDGFEYGVDAGLIGLIPVRAITRDRAEVERLCNKVSLARDTLCTNVNGKMTFGKIKIDTTDGDER